MLDTSGTLRTGLEFAPNTTEDCKKLIGRLHTPASILGAYRAAREQFGTTDVVLAASDQVGHIEFMPRRTYCEHLKQLFGDKAQGFKMWSTSAQTIMKLPRDSEAMWFVVDVSGADLPIMCVIYATPYKVEPSEVN